MIRPNDNQTLADFDIDAGYAFHLAIIDLPVGTYQFMWETRMGVIDGSLPPYERYQMEYRAAIDDITVFNEPCEMRSKVITLIHVYGYNVNVYHY